MGTPNGSFYRCAGVSGAIGFLQLSKASPKKQGEEGGIQEMSEQKSANGLDFEALRHAIERCDPEILLDFYADDASLSIFSAEAPRTLPFQLYGRAEIAKHLRAVYGHGESHRVEGEAAVGEDRLTFREACEFPDGDRLVIETTLEVNDGKIVRQVDVVAKDARTNSQEGSGLGPPTRSTSAGVDAPLPDRLLWSKQATEKEDYR